jgi:hypothetical protein
VAWAPPEDDGENDRFGVKNTLKKDIDIGTTSITE